MGEWKRVKLGDLIRPVSETYHAKHDLVVLVNTSDVFEGKITNHLLVPNENLAGQFKKTFQKGDILFSEIRPANKRYALVVQDDTSNYIASTKLMVLRLVDKTVDLQFIYHFLTSNCMLTYLQSRAEDRSGTFPQITFESELNDFVLDIPDLPTQRRIAVVLGALDDKIEVNRKICENLEAQAQALFKAWFVDFEPFKGTMVDDSLWGEHPKELEYVRVGDLNPVLEAGSRPKGGAATSGIPSIGAENVKQLGVFDFGSKKYIPVEFAQKLKRGKIQGYELLLYKDGGKPGMFKPHFSMFGEGFPYEECYINEHVFKVDFGSCETNVFAYFYFKSQYVFSWLETNGAKAAIPGINQANVLDVMMPDPKHALVKQFGEKVLPVFKMIFIKCKESRALAAMRDALLPKLMSGELAVEKVEGV